jgi:transcriptional regulator with XRE-family HTH domain
MSDKKECEVISIEKLKNERNEKLLHQLQVEMEASQKRLLSWIEEVIAESGIEQGPTESRMQTFARAIGIPYPELMKILKEKVKGAEKLFPGKSR